MINKLLDAETSLWTSWTRVRGPEKRVTRYKISCTSKSVVMKSLKLRVLHNETMNCTKELCIGKLEMMFQHIFHFNYSTSSLMLQIQNINPILFCLGVHLHFW
jgi:hypothetical protein